MSSWSLALLLAAVGPAMAAAPLPPATQPHVHYMVVVTGGELLSGAIADGHTQFLARTLRPLGLECVGSMTVDDRLPDIKQAIAFARGNAPLVIVTGGLGPTDNDVTRQALTEATGIALREHPQAIADMEKRFKTPRDQLRANLRRQTHVPQRGTYLKNANGTAVGLVFEMDDAVVVALPGPPRELQPMVRDELVPYLSKRFGTSLPGPSLTIRFIGLGQSQISQTLNERVAVPADVILCSQFEGGRVDFTFSLPYDTPANRGRLEELKKRIHQQLDDNIYADDQTTLEQHVLTLLAQRRATLALVEAGSAGGLAAALAGAESDRGVLTGAYVAPTEERLRKLLQVNDKPWAEARSSVEKAKLLAEAAAKLSNADWVVVVGEAQRDQGGENVAEVVFRMPQGRVETRRINIRGTGELARAGITTQLLDEMRLRLR
jgi:nicotinamide-nucleotide amidase